MDIEELMILLEKSRKSLQVVEETLYDELREKIEELEKLRKTTNSDEEIQRIDDELRTLRRIQRRLFEERTGKIIRAAWAEVCGTVSGIEGLDNLTSREVLFYRSLVDVISSFRDEVLYGHSVKSGEKEVADEPDAYRIVRILDNVEFEGIDGKTYKLRKEDVVSLPSLNANALIKGGAAEVVEIKR
ncbi:MAG: hypothetical protein DSY33_00130 [Archaeoglobus sp.]|jgi:DNA replication factor GINS|nr:MAG: hypothetical protein DSY33_00130 [Archaeoglobus sp.]